jgi:hypothetical protein
MDGLERKKKKGGFTAKVVKVKRKLSKTREVTMKIPTC